MAEVLKSVVPDMDHEAFRQDLLALLAGHGDRLQPVELLAIAANLVGQIIACQDPDKLTPSAAIELVQHNIQLGNRTAVEHAHRLLGGRLN